MLEWQCRQILMATGPSGPRVGREQILILPAGINRPAEVTRFRKWGTGGKVTMSARSAKALIGAVPRRSWFFPSLERTLRPLPPHRAERCSSVQVINNARRPKIFPKPPPKINSQQQRHPGHTGEDHQLSEGGDGLALPRLQPHDHGHDQKQDHHHRRQKTPEPVPGQAAAQILCRRAQQERQQKKIPMTMGMARRLLYTKRWERISPPWI